jgi:hypothetical protein
MTPSDQIKEQYKMEWRVLAQKVDACVEARVRHICARLRGRTPINITRIDCGMGSYALSGDDYPVYHDDGSEGSHNVEEIFDFVPTRGRKYDTPVGVTHEEFRLIEELEDLLSWWVDTTGGQDVDMANPG